MRISDWSSDVCSSDLQLYHHLQDGVVAARQERADNRGKLNDSAQRRMDVAPFRPTADRARHGDPVDALFANEAFYACNVANADAGNLETVEGLIGFVRTGDAHRIKPGASLRLDTMKSPLTVSADPCHAPLPPHP